MRAVWLENRTLSFRSGVSMPAPGPGEALVAVRLAGICATDLELLKGYYPFSGIPGHEFVGRIAASPAGLIDGRYPLERAAEAFAHAAKPGALKILLEIG